MLVNAMYSEVRKTWLWVCDRSRFVKPDALSVRANISSMCLRHNQTEPRIVLDFTHI